MSTSEPAAEREAGLEKLRRRMGRAARRGEAGELERLAGEYAKLKAEHSAASDAEMKAVMRARRARERAQVADRRPEPWRLPAGFGVSPLAAVRARGGRPREEPVKPAGGLSPWRRGDRGMRERLWP